MIEYSPTGQKVVPSSGPLGARLVFIGESPAKEELKQGIPLVGKSGKMLGSALRIAGIDRDSCYVMNLVPVRAPGDKFADHSDIDKEWGRARFTDEISRLRSAKVFVTLGANPTEWLLGCKPPVVQRGENKKEGFIGQWRGSIIPNLDDLPEPMHESPEEYLVHIPHVEESVLPKGSVIIPTYHPAAILRQFTWHPWFVLDIKKAARILREGVPKTKYRQWFFQNVTELKRLANSDIDLISVDTELEPQIIAIATEEEVHVFDWSEAYREPLTKLLTSNRIWKIAHNWGHDYADLRVKKGITVSRPIYDTQGGAHVLNMALQKELSPHISTRFTDWPYHKFMADIDPWVYCGMDAVVCYDSYWPQIEQLSKRDLYQIADHDHKLLTPLMEMQATGFKIDEQERQKVEAELHCGGLCPEHAKSIS